MWWNFAQTAIVADLTQSREITHACSYACARPRTLARTNTHTHTYTHTHSHTHTHKHTHAHTHTHKHTHTHIHTNTNTHKRIHTHTTCVLVQIAAFEALEAEAQTLRSRGSEAAKAAALNRAEKERSVSLCCFRAAISNPSQACLLK